jgi:heat shock protein HtpX
VAERGGVWGFGARRIMGLGLPVIQSLTVDELRSVIAHEFGHYASGDTTFSSWIYTARAAVVRSVATLHAVNSLVHLPFKWYAQFFMRLTLRIARRQEFAADALAARLTSAAAAASALRTICSSRYDTFWSQELAPVLRCGLLPPITAGFEIFQRERCEDLEIQEERGSAYDTHPPLALRLGALSNLPANARFDVDARSAVALLRDLAKIERRMVEGQAGPPAGGWKLVDWRDCAAAVFVPYWETEVDKFADIFSFVQFKDVPSIVPDRVASRVGSEYQALAPEADRAYAQVLVGRAAGLALARDGWAGIGTPGDPVWFSKGSRRMNPSALVKDLWAGKLGDADWRKMASEAGVSNLPLTAAQSGALTDHRNFLPAPR